MATFKEAFREARKAGKKVFTWNGKPYTTELKEEKQAKKADTAKAAPSAGPRRDKAAEAKADAA